VRICVTRQAYRLHRALNAAVWRANPVADGKRPVEKNHQSAKEIRQQAACGKTNSNTTDTAQGQYAGDRKPEGLHEHQHARDNDGRAQQLGHRCGSGSVYLMQVLILNEILLLRSG
jgi:hypothetical protein